MRFIFPSIRCFEQKAEKHLISGYVILVKEIMSKDKIQADHRLNANCVDASTGKKGTEKLIEVRKRDNAEDRDNTFILHERPFDEQMYNSFDDLRKDQKDEEAD